MMVEIITEKFFIYGHKNILGTHKSTIEFTKVKDLTTRGNCVIGVSSEKGLNQFNNKFKELAKSSNADITCKIIAGNNIETIKGKGNPKLTFKDSEDIVIRKSDFICNRTVMIKADKSAKDLGKRLIDKLKNPNYKAQVIFEVKI